MRRLRVHLNAQLNARLGAWLDAAAPRADQIALRQPEHALWQADEPGAYCWRCGASCGLGAVTGRGCAVCLKRRFAWDRIVRLGEYHDHMHEWITEMKFGRQWSWTRFFASHLAAS